MNGFKAVIFDMDGVLVDSETAYMRQYQGIMATQGVDLPIDAFYGLAGGSMEDLYRLMTSRLAIDRPRAVAICDAFFEHSHVDYSLLVRPTAQPLLRSLADRGLRLALASSSPMASINAMLDSCGLKSFFELVVSGDDFKKTKPDPEIYQYTVRRLGLGQKEVAVVEDSTYGMQAAKGAGLFTIALRDPRFNFRTELADVVIEDLAQVQDVIQQ